MGNWFVQALAAALATDAHFQCLHKHEKRRKKNKV